MSKFLSKHWMKIGIAILIIAILVDIYFRMTNPRNEKHHGSNIEQVYITYTV